MIVLKQKTFSTQELFLNGMIFLVNKSLKITFVMYAAKPANQNKRTLFEILKTRSFHKEHMLNCTSEKI
jgi:hypothetical protein